MVLSTDVYRERVLAKCDLAYALIALVRAVGGRELDIVKRTYEWITTASFEELAHIEFTLDINIQNAENAAGFHGDTELLTDMGKLYREQPFEIYELPKVAIDEMFSNYGNVFPMWKAVQPHAMVHIDFKGQDRDLFLPEASLYEDMCFAYNNALATEKRTTKEQVKAHVFYVRSCIISAFNFVEAFLNGLAFDFIAEPGRPLSESERDLLTEWDTKRDRKRFVNFRDKALQYPKLILNRPAPPYTESSCAPFHSLMKNIHLRDAVVHSSPALSEVDQKMAKVLHLISLGVTGLSRATEVVDSAVRFVIYLDQLVNAGKYDNTWLLRRDPAGGFPPESFA